MTASEDDNRAQRAKLAGGVLTGAGVLAVATWIAIAAGAIARKPGLESILTGIFGGGFVALLIMGAAAWIGITMVAGRPKTPDLSAGDSSWLARSVLFVQVLARTVLPYLRGQFEGRFQVNAPGEYQLELAVPGSSEIIRRKITVTETMVE